MTNDERRIDFATPPTSEPLTFDKPLKVEFTYIDERPMTHEEANQIFSSKMPLALKDLNFIIEYQSEKRKKYYSQYSPMGGNNEITGDPFLQLYKKVYCS